MSNREYCPGVCVYVFSLVLSLLPVLEARPSHPVEGQSVTLTCKTQLHEQGPSVKFCFSSNVKFLGSGCRSSPKLQIPAIWKEDPESYWCRTTQQGSKWSLPTNIHVQRIPVSDVSLKTWPAGGWVMEGNKLVLICSVAKGTGKITYIWYRGALGLNLGTKIQRSLTAEFEITGAKASDAEQYYCAADNGYGPVLSELVGVTVRVPVSRPVLTFGNYGTQAVLGGLVELHCEALRGSPPIFYQFYHENVVLGNSSAPSGGGTSFNFSLTVAHSGNFSCEASNGQGAQRSEVMMLNVTGICQVWGLPSENGNSPLTAGVTDWLLGSLGCLGLSTMALIFCYWLRRKMGRPSDDPLRSPPRPVLQESNYLNSPDAEQPQPVYENVTVARGDEVYSLVYHTEQELEPAAAQRLRTHGTNEVSKVSFEIYSKPRKINMADVDYEDAM
ncbi:Fc receptor-like protein 1 [Acomys russatus]|uniref:Fc receptor-like protein 1 n=1 Tax=Acomys russatus TaxID=60746 RepID=UPI0021E1FC58|nr:Fc receptor-like protein 1 [Acomys russatus]